MKNPKILVRSILFQLTQKCALKCSHCFMSASKKGQSLEPKQIEKIVPHIPSDVQSIILTGGDPFMEKTFLLGAVKAIMDRKFSHLGTLSVQTTGYWAVDGKKAEDELKILINAGVNEFSIYGNDEWHIKGGLNPKFQDNIVEVLKDYGFEPEDKSSREAALKQLYDYKRRKYTLRGTGYKINPTGRGASYKDDKSRIRLDCNPTCNSGRDFLTLHRQGYYYVINYKGDVHHCIWQKTPPLGNAIEESIPAMLKRAKTNKLRCLEDKGNVLNLAAYLGYSKEKASLELNETGRCQFHEKLINEYQKNNVR